MYPPNVTGNEPEIIGGPDTEGHCHKCLENGHEWPLSDCEFLGEYWCGKHLVEAFEDELRTLAAEVFTEKIADGCTFYVFERGVEVTAPANDFNGNPPQFDIGWSALERVYNEMKGAK